MLDKGKKSKKTTHIVKKVEDAAVNLQSNTSGHIQKHLTKRVQRTKGVKRFIFGWIALVVVVSISTVVFAVQLQKGHLVAAPAEGGNYSEGIVGRVNSLNPLYSSGQVDDSVTALIFNGLLKYDIAGQLTGDLAKSWSVDSSRKIYNLQLRNDITWHDGQPFTAEDVVFTIQTIQDAKTKSSLRSNWNGITVAAKGRYQVSIILPAPFSPFPHSLTVPIVPRHLLSDVNGSLRTAAFSNSPVGTGPFAFQSMRRSDNSRTIEMKRNSVYFWGPPKLDGFTIKTYEDSESLLTAAKRREVSAAVGLNLSDSVSLENDSSLEISSSALNSGVYAFINTESPITKDVKLRKALASATSRQPLIEMFNAKYATLSSVILPSQLGYNSSYDQIFNKKKSMRDLDSLGWKMKDKVRTKGAKRLQLTLKTLDTPEYKLVASELKNQWAAVGIQLDVSLLSAEQLQQIALNDRGYDILLYGITIGSDPDVYAYWHSSQAKSGGLNFSQWQSTLADSALEIGRSRDDTVLRRARYSAFQKQWNQATPAIALYQPRALYVHHKNAAGFKSFPINNISARFTNVQNWTISTKSVHRTP